jgi:hypothetical protein
MGYTTDFEGKFTINKPVDDDTYNLLKGIATTRRMKRSGLSEKYGIDGEFYFEKEDFGNCGQSDKPKQGRIVDYNNPPRTQPGLWCQWLIQEDRKTIEWDEGEKFYDYVEWIEYLIVTILSPRGYKVNGEVTWQGEDGYDMGKIIIKDNKVTTKQGKVSYR